MHGHAKIELTNPKTGQTQVIENDNMVTNALNDLFGSNLFCNVAYPPLVSTRENHLMDKYYPIIPNAIGGIYLFNKPLPENKDNYYAPIDNKLIGCGSNDTNSTNLIKKRGNFNLTNSKFSDDNKSYTFVWDFNQEQGNGEFSSICLTSALGGKSYFTDAENNPFSLIRNSTYWNASENLFPGVIYKIDFENGLIYTAYYDYSSKKMSFYKTAILNSGIMHLKTRTNNELLSTNTITINITNSDRNRSASVYEIGDYLYAAIFPSKMLCYCSANNEPNSFYYNKNYQGFHLVKIDKKTFEVLEEKDVLTDSGYNFIGSFGYRDNYDTGTNLVYKNYIVLTSLHESNKHITTTLYDPESETFEPFEDTNHPILIFGDGLITITGTYDLRTKEKISSHSNSTLYNKLNCYMGLFAPSSNNYPQLTLFSHIYKNYIFTQQMNGSSYYNRLAVLPQYLVTINNLPEPITKTSDQTMRITYTLSED